MNSSCIYTYNAILGYGTEFKPPEEVIYHSHVADKKAGKIYVLLTTFGEGEPRLHIYPWSEELEKQLEEGLLEELDRIKQQIEQENELYNNYEKIKHLHFGPDLSLEFCGKFPRANCAEIRAYQYESGDFYHATKKSGFEDFGGICQDPRSAAQRDGRRGARRR